MKLSLSGIKKSKSLTLKRLLPYLTRNSFLLGIGTLAVLLTVIISFSMGIVVQLVIDQYPKDPVEASLFLNKALIYSLIAVISLSIFGFIGAYSLRKLATKVVQEMRSNIFDNILGKDFEYIENQASGDLQTRIVADTDAVGNFLSYQVPTILTVVLSLIVGIVGAVYVSLKMTFLVLVCLPIIFIPLIILNKQLHGLGTQIQASIANIGRYAGEAFRNIKVIRAYGKEKEESEKFNKLTNVTVDNILKTARLELGLGTIVEGLVLLGFCFLIWSAAKDILHNKMTVGELVSFAYFTLFIVRSGAGLLRIVTSINVAIGTATKIVEYLSMETHDWPSSVQEFNSRGAIEFRGVSFSYPNRPDVTVVNNVELTLPAGAHIALVGSSGAGKSTLFELLLRFYEPSQGVISLSGLDIKSLDSSVWRSIIGYVPQKESLVSGTVYENIAYGVDKANEENVIEAAKMAHAHQFIIDLPQGYHTDLGEVGGRLSGGQKQRIALARALIRNPQVLLLDEAKSALDTESEQLVADAIGRWAKTKQATVISIAHRLSTVREADLIIAMESGYIVGQGTHEYLMRECGLYQRLSFADLKNSDNHEYHNSDATVYNYETEEVII
jgi:ATP-binding cassette, subfamily B, bacterial